MNNEKIQKIEITDELTLSLIHLKTIRSCKGCKSRYNKKVITVNKLGNELETSKIACRIYTGMEDNISCINYFKK
jgi:hypothetical protein